MRILIGAFGSRGDVQPMLALALALRADRHRVTVCAPPDFATWTSELSLPFHPVGESVQSLLARCANKDGNLPMRVIMREMPRLLVDQFPTMEPLVRDADAVVSTLSWAGASLAEKYDIPYHNVVFSPSLFPSRRHPAPFIQSQGLPRWVNALTWRLNDRVARLFLKKPINAARARLGLKPLGDVWNDLLWRRPMLASEPSFAPPPPDMRADVLQTGAWFMPEREELDRDLEAFLRAGPPPVYIGFGSMPDKDPVATSRLVVRAVLAAEARALLSRGWAGLGVVELPPTVRVIGPTPHGKLFPCVAAVVHHGGAGTTANAARAGVPQVIVPHLLDQFFWCHRAWQLGLTPRPIANRRRLTASSLAEAIRACVTDEELRDRARAFAGGVVTDGVQRAVRVIAGESAPAAAVE